MSDVFSRERFIEILDLYHFGVNLTGWIKSRSDTNGSVRVINIPADNGNACLKRNMVESGLPGSCFAAGPRRGDGEDQSIGFGKCPDHCPDGVSFDGPVNGNAAQFDQQPFEGPGKERMFGHPVHRDFESEYDQHEKHKIPVG